MAIESGLVGHWPLTDDGRDHSGQGHHGERRGSVVQIPSRTSLDLGRGDFTVAAWVWTAPGRDGAPGDVLARYDPARRRGFTLSLTAGGGGYSGLGEETHVQFGIDDGTEPVWEACGRPSPTSSYVSNSLTVFDGHLYAATTDGASESEWARVWRYAGGQAWESCGRLGTGRTRGAGPMVVHGGALYAATWSYDWTRVHTEPLDFCRVYRYHGGEEWKECGQPGECLRLFSLASYRGSLYVIGDDNRCYFYDGDRTWRQCGLFAHMTHPMTVHDGRLYAGVFNAAVLAYDGATWEDLGNPLGTVERCNQIHTLAVYHDRLHAATWPEGRVARYEPDSGWASCGRLGDSTEINGLSVYNGKLYGGTIPRAELFRYEGGEVWTPLRRFFDPPGWEPIPVDHPPAPDAGQRVAEWTRVTSLAAYDGRLFASLGSCTGAVQDAPCDVRGEVHAMRAGQVVTYDRDPGSGWRHLAAVKEGGRLSLWLNGARVALSAPFDPNAFDLSPDVPLTLGAGETSALSGRLRDVRLYRHALDTGEIAQITGSQPED